MVTTEAISNASGLKLSFPTEVSRTMLNALRKNMPVAYFTPLKLNSVKGRNIVHTPMGAKAKKHPF